MGHASVSWRVWIKGRSGSVFAVAFQAADRLWLGAANKPGGQTGRPSTAPSARQTPPPSRQASEAAKRPLAPGAGTTFASTCCLHAFKSAHLLLWLDGCRGKCADAGACDAHLVIVYMRLEGPMHHIGCVWCSRGAGALAQPAAHGRACCASVQCCRGGCAGRCCGACAQRRGGGSAGCQPASRGCWQQGGRASASASGTWHGGHGAAG